ncbi:MAG: hypothetical protein WC285_06170 [Candidatus Gracilibacteria bacterium]|jgi:hypothetical protein
METKFISIQEASDLSQKSIQTIRRAIKSKKLKVRKMKTPQGFNYLVDKDSLCGFYGLRITEKPEMPASSPAAGQASGMTSEEPIRNFSTERTTSKSTGRDMISADDFRNFTKVLDKMVNQHSDERQNFMRLVNTLQEKIFVLENQMNLLKTPEKKWYQLWK